MNEPQTVKKPVGQVVREAFKELGETLVAFIKAPRALWGINLPYVLEGLVYFGLLTILGKFCSENVGLTDPQAGFVYSAVTGGITFAMLLLGGVTDKIGVRNSLFLSLTMMMFGRILISLSDTLSLGNGLWSPMFILMSVGLLIMVTAYGLYQPAAYAGVKRYTNPQTAAVGYAVIYALMNLGAFIFGPISSFTRNAFESAFPPNGLGAVLWVLTGITLIAALLSRVIITKRVDRNAVDRVQREANAMKEKGQLKKEPEAKATEESVQQPAGPLEKIDNKKLIWYGMVTAIAVVMWILSMVGILALPSLLMLIVTLGLIVLSTYEYLRHRPDHPFRDVRLVFFIFILIPVQTLFAHNWLTIPYYLDRAFTGTWVSHHFEILSNLNPIIIFVITPIIAGLTARANVYRMMILGTFIMAAPTFLLTLGPIAWVFVVYIVIMSVGEAMWQPRFLQWIAEIAPEGKTGAYMGIGQFPWFLTKVLTGLYSGYFVAEYVPLPETGEPMQTGKMWFIYALIAMVSPVALWLAKSWMVKGMKKGN